MDSRTPRSSRPLLAAPAGNFEKLRFAVRYGADEVYLGGGELNLRAKADNFSPAELERAIELCRKSGVRTTYLLNSFLHEGDLERARRHIAGIAQFPFDAVMISDPGMLLLLREAGNTSRLHLSTQVSTLNHMAVRFWLDQGISRIVLGREATLSDVERIRARTEGQIEVFAHGALCISYSGRCLLSRFLAGRDANRGECAHPCRWRYSLIEEKRPGAPLEVLEHARGTEILASRDLCLIERLPDFAAAGVDAFKIEGRMKSVYYTANTTRVYRRALEVIDSRGDYTAQLPLWREELDLVDHRPYTAHPFDDQAAPDASPPYVRRTEFAGSRLDEGGDSVEALIKAYNPIRVGELLEAIFPFDKGVVRDGIFQIEEISDGEKSVAMAQPGREYLIKFDRPVGGDALLRRRIADEKE